MGAFYTKIGTFYTKNGAFYTENGTLNTENGTLYTVFRTKNRLTYCKQKKIGKIAAKTDDFLKHTRISGF